MKKLKLEQKLSSVLKRPRHQPQVSIPFFRLEVEKTFKLFGLE